MKHTLPNGIIIDDDGGLSKSAQQYALKKGLDNVRVFLATHKDGASEYIIVEDQEVVFADQSFEGIAVHLDIIALAKRCDKIDADQATTKVEQPNESGKKRDRIKKPARRIKE